MISGIVAWDGYIGHLVEASRTPFLNDIFFFLTQLGDARWIAVVALGIAFVLWRHKQYAYKIAFAVALFGSLGSSYLIKILVVRPRPPLSEHLINVSGYSFPSMHAAVSVAVYGFLAYIAFKLLRPQHHRAPVTIGLSALALLIGFSRVYLGVHYASDVLAGYVLGALCVWLGVQTLQALRKYRFT